MFVMLLASLWAHESMCNDLLPLEVDLRVGSDFVSLHMDHATSPSLGHPHGGVGQPHLGGSRCSFPSDLLAPIFKYQEYMWNHLLIKIYLCHGILHLFPRQMMVF